MALEEGTQSLELAQKRNNKLEKALKESQDNQNKTKVCLNNMCKQNLYLCKDLAKSMQDGSSVGGNAFQNALQQV